MIWHDLANHHGEYHSLDHWIVHARFMDHGHPMMDSKIHDGSPQQKSPVAPSSFRTAKRCRKICCCSQLINLIQGAPVLPMMNLAVNGMITPSMLWKADSLAKIFTRSFCKVESLIHNLPSIFFEKTQYQLVVELIDLKDVPKKVKIGSFPQFFRDKHKTIFVYPIT